MMTPRERAEDIWIKLGNPTLSYAEKIKRLRECIAEEREALRITGGWDRYYANLPADLKQRLSIHDFKRLGDVFCEAFGIPETRRPFDWGALGQ